MIPSRAERSARGTIIGKNVPLAGLKVRGGNGNDRNCTARGPQSHKPYSVWPPMNSRRMLVGGMAAISEG